MAGKMTQEGTDDILQEIFPLAAETPASQRSDLLDQIRVLTDQVDLSTFSDERLAWLQESFASVVRKIQDEINRRNSVAAQNPHGNGDPEASESLFGDCSTPGGHEPPANGSMYQAGSILSFQATPVQSRPQPSLWSGNASSSAQALPMHPFAGSGFPGGEFGNMGWQPPMPNHCYNTGGYAGQLPSSSYAAPVMQGPSGSSTVGNNSGSYAAPSPPSRYPAPLMQDPGGNNSGSYAAPLMQDPGSNNTGGNNTGGDAAPLPPGNAENQYTGSSWELEGSMPSPGIGPKDPTLPPPS